LIHESCWIRSKCYRCSANCGRGSTVAQCVQSFAGVRARINQRTFQYLSYIASDVINREITRTAIAPITECLPGPLITGCINAYNLYVSRYRPPKSIAIHPSSPNKLVLSIDDLDLGLTGNLGGQINVLLPLSLYGIVQANVYGASLLVEVIIDKSSQCTLCMKVVGCSVKFRYVDICIQNGGLVGDLANGLFRQQINNMVGEKINGKVCSMVSQLVNEKINPKLREVPMSMPLTQLFSLAGNNLISSSVQQCSKRRNKCFGTSLLSQMSVLKQQHSGVASTLKSNRINDKAVKGTVTVNSTAIDPEQKRSELDNINRLSELLTDGDADVTDTAPQAHLASDLKNLTTLIPNIRHPNRDDQKVAQAVIGNTYKATVIDKDTHSKEKRRRLKRAMAQSPTTLRKVKSTAVDSDTAIKIPSRSKFRQQLHNATAARLHAASKHSHNSQRTFVVSAVTTKQTPVITHPDHRSSLVQQHGATVMLLNPTNQKQADSTKIPLIVNDKAVIDVKKSIVMSGTARKRKKARVHACPTVCASGKANALSDEENPCAGCPGADSVSDPMSVIVEILKSIDVSKLCNIVMNMELLSTYSSCCDYSAAFSGAFSVCGQLPPICPAPYNFPPNPDTNAMVELLISEYTINSLLYQLYRSGALSGVVGPQTPKAGEFLRTTCSSGSKLTKMLSGGDLDDLSICLGDILPTFSERYPKKSVSLRIYANSQPLVLLISRDALSVPINCNFPGCGTIRLDVGVDFCLSTINQCDQSNRVGTIDIIAVTTICITFQNEQLYGNAVVSELNIIDNQQTLGMDADGLQRFSMLGKELLSKVSSISISGNIPDYIRL
uniref:BPI2 domain-containing protein n=1 Tax=Syphacia muris TaxID=451379 RepID=A0A0N5AIX7_9BILA